MVRKIVVIGMVGVMVVAQLSVVLAEEVPIEQACRNEIAVGIYEISGFIRDDNPNGYLQQINRLLSTSQPSSTLIEPVKQKIRDAQAEFEMLCRAAQKFDGMSDYERDGFGFRACADPRLEDQQQRRALVDYCSRESSTFLNLLMAMVPQRLEWDALEESTRQLVDAYRRFNSKMQTLLSEYSRLIDNILLLNMRLGDMVVTESD